MPTGVKAAECDGCGFLKRDDTAVPHGWISISIGIEGNEKPTKLIACSKSCATKAAETYLATASVQAGPSTSSPEEKL